MAALRSSSSAIARRSSRDMSSNYGRGFAGSTTPAAPVAPVAGGLEGGGGGGNYIPNWSSPGYFPPPTPTPAPAAPVEQQQAMSPTLNLPQEVLTPGYEQQGPMAGLAGALGRRNPPPLSAALEGLRRVF